MRAACLGIAATAGALVAVSAVARKRDERRRDFSADPGREGYRNRLVPVPAPPTARNSATN